MKAQKKDETTGGFLGRRGVNPPKNPQKTDPKLNPILLSCSPNY